MPKRFIQVNLCTRRTELARDLADVAGGALDELAQPFAIGQGIAFGVDRGVRPGALLVQVVDELRLQLGELRQRDRRRAAYQDQRAHERLARERSRFRGTPFVRHGAPQDQGENRVMRILARGCSLLSIFSFHSSCACGRQDHFPASVAAIHFAGRVQERTGPDPPPPPS
jgi:hypothetical protein